jgi:hypothetical protein
VNAEVADVLRKAREKISDPARWTKGEFARDVHGKGLNNGCDPTATCYCALGAVEAVVNAPFFSMNAHSVVTALNACVNGDSIADINDADTTTHADILAAFDRAIAAAESAR